MCPTILDDNTMNKCDKSMCDEQSRLIQINSRICICVCYHLLVIFQHCKHCRHLKPKALFYLLFLVIKVKWTNEQLPHLCWCYIMHCIICMHVMYSLNYRNYWRIYSEHKLSYIMQLSMLDQIWIKLKNIALL